MMNPAQIDALPVVSDPSRAPANDGPAQSATLGDIIAALQDEADAVAWSEAEADAMVIDAVFGLQFEVRIDEHAAAGDRKAA